jgi:hypothetical protein
LAECGTHAVFAARVGTYPQSEATLTRSLLDRLEPGMLLLADRGFFSYALWRKAIATGADLLWRVRTDKAGPKPTHLEDLPDGSWLAHLRRSTPAAARSEEPMPVRVIDYSIDDGRENPTNYRLITTMLDPDEVTAVDLAAAYTQRWEIELAFDELKTHQRGPRTVLRSKSPDLVLQEIWGHLCCHYAIRSLMTEAATHSRHDPDRISFVAALRITRQTVAHPGAFPLCQNARDSPGWLTFLRRLLRRLNPIRRARTAPRVIKRKMPKWHVKRGNHTAWPQPQHPPDYLIGGTN